MRIDRCLCSDCTFAEMAKVARRHEADTVEELEKHIGFGLRCRLCIPYVREMLRTGDTVFSRIIQDDKPDTESRPEATRAPESGKSGS